MAVDGCRCFPPAMLSCSYPWKIGKSKKKKGEVGRFKAREGRLRANNGWSRGVGVLAFQVLMPTDVPWGSPLHTRIKHWVDSGGK
jgi:hypothetical protein